MFARRGVSLSARPRLIAMLLTAVVAVAVLALTAPATKAAAAELPGSIIDGGYIISDAEFYNSTSMTEAQIQTFLNGKATCASGATCLENYRGDLTAQPKDTYCAGAAAEKNVTAARMIYRAATSCKINPKVIIVMLQKEQGLVTSNKPSDWNLEHAMGQSCPDDTGCSAAAAGFWKQVYLGARQMQIYTKYPTSFTYRAGQYNTIKWAPSSTCGTSKVLIKNQATANLYNYTPYRPNIAALAAGWGTGDTCSTYGNRNFYNYYVAWFAPGASSSKGAPAQVSACTNPASADVAIRTGKASVGVQELNARTAPTTLCGTGVQTLGKDTSVTITGVYGAWTQIAVGGKKLWVVSSYLTTSGSSGSDSGAAPAGTGCAVPATVTAASGTAVVTVAQLNARTAPSTDCSTGVQTIKQGQTYARTGTYGQWWRITVGSKTMWAHSDYLALEQVTEPSKPSEPSKPAQPQVQTATTTAALNLRSSASLSASVVTVIPKSKTVTITKTSGNWSQVSYGSKSGWVANAYLSGFKTSVPVASTPSTSTKPTSTKPSAPSTTKTATVKVALNLRASGSLSAKIITVLPRGAKVTVTKTSGSWSQVRYGSKTGWVANQYLSSTSSSASSSSSSSPAASVTKKTTAALNLRASGSLSAKVLTVIPRGGKVTVTKTSGSWSQVRYGSRTGWVANRYLA